MFPNNHNLIVLFPFSIFGQFVNIFGARYNFFPKNQKQNIRTKNIFYFPFVSFEQQSGLFKTSKSFELETLLSPPPLLPKSPKTDNVIT